MGKSLAFTFSTVEIWADEMKCLRTALEVECDEGRQKTVADENIEKVQNMMPNDQRLKVYGIGYASFSLRQCIRLQSCLGNDKVKIYFLLTFSYSQILRNFNLVYVLDEMHT